MHPNTPGTNTSVCYWHAIRWRTQSAKLSYEHLHQSIHNNSIWISIHFRLFCRESAGVRANDLFMSFKSIFQDVRSAMDHVHIHGDLQNATVAVSALALFPILSSQFTFFPLFAICHFRIWINMWRKIRACRWCCHVYVNRVQSVSYWQTVDSFSPIKSWRILWTSRTVANWMSRIVHGRRTSTWLSSTQRNHYSSAKERYCDRWTQRPVHYVWARTPVTYVKDKCIRVARAMYSHRYWAPREKMYCTLAIIFSVTFWRVRKYGAGVRSWWCRNWCKSCMCGPTNVNCLLSYKIWISIWATCTSM